ncbi:MAG: S-methyl-5'-thioinosine phosphorylase [Candidatus Sedimenticola sp. (ex Thyasira tokunagai)]
MAEVAIIGGSGLAQLDELCIYHREAVATPFGDPSAALMQGTFNGVEVIFIPRHGDPHTIPPHKVNYRANLWALKQLGIEQVIGVAAVGGITSKMGPQMVAVPDQIIDYTYNRPHTFFEENLSRVTHIDFTEPYCEQLRQQLISAAQQSEIDIVTGGTYGATQGPRLESTMEIHRMEQDGCDLVGMTGMPEAALAKELNLSYACCAVVANWAAGKGEGPITMDEIHAHLDAGMEKVRLILSSAVASL